MLAILLFRIFSPWFRAATNFLQFLTVQNPNDVNLQLYKTEEWQTLTFEKPEPHLAECLAFYINK